jgi:uracil-DNA glycosylase
MPPGSPISPAAALLVDRLSSLRFADVFNPYSDVCGAHDLADAPAIRRANLLATFDAASEGTDEMWVGLEPGHRGARRTGLAMTDDARLSSHAAHWGLSSLKRATRSGPDTEQTAGIVWEALAHVRRRVLLWNVFPLHCHQRGRPLSNRRHTQAEWLACRDLLADVAAMAKPRRIVAIGREAEKALTALGLRCVAVRHPAYGGKAAFLNGVGPC